MNIGFDPTKFQERVVVDQFTRTPNTIVDDYMAEMPPLAFKCYMLILRKTIGFNKPYAKIATSVFMKSCGIKTEGAVAKNLKYLEQIGALKVIRRTGEMNIFQLCQLKNVEKPSQTPPPPINNTTPDKQGGSTHVEQGGTPPDEQGSIKENSKYTFKESSSSYAKPFFEVQKGTHFIHYFDNDSRSYTLENLCNVYDVEQNFFDQAKASHPDVTENKLKEIWSDLTGWSLTCTEDWKKTKIPLQWMTTWLNSVAKNKHKPQTKASYQPKPKSALQQTADQWAEERFAEQQKSSSIIDVNQDQVLIGGEREYF